MAVVVIVVVMFPKKDSKDDSWTSGGALPATTEGSNQS